MDTKQNEIFRAMADPHRRQILGELCRESREAGELARMVGLAPNAVSFHLRALKAAELVTVRREGRFLRYSLEPESVAAWREQVEQLFPRNLLGTVSPAKPRTSRFESSAATTLPRSRSDDQLPTELL